MIPAARKSRSTRIVFEDDKVDIWECDLLRGGIRSLVWDCAWRHCLETRNPMAKRSEKKNALGGDDSRPAPRKMVSVPPLPSWLNRDWMWGLLLVLAVFVTYTPVWWAGFIWDDDAFITNNPCIVGPRGLKEIWTTSAADICPLTLTTVWVEHALWGLNPLPYHLVNVLLHAACAVLLWRVLLGLHVPKPGAWLGATLWALHPVQVESVAWITEIKNTQSGLFYLLSILFFMKYLRARDSNPEGEERISSGWNYGLTLLFAALAMASKSSTVILPVVLCLCAWWIEGEWQWRKLARIAPIFLLSVAACALSIWTQGIQLETANDPQWARAWPERLITAGDAVWFYLSKLLWPHPLITIYPRWQIEIEQWISYLPILAVLMVLSVLWLKSGSWSRSCFFAFAYFLMALFPILGFLNVYFFRYSFVSDHLQYLAGMGPLALMGAVLARLADLIIPRRCKLQSALSAGLLLVLGTLSWQRACVYESHETLWMDTLRHNPAAWSAYNNLGSAFLRKKQLDKAIEQFQKALEINPNNAGAHNNLGDALSQKGRIDEAIEQFQKALEINPNFAEAHSNLGNALVQKGLVNEAMIQYEKSLEIDPNYAEAHYNLGVAFVKKGQVNDAIEQFQKALEINPNDAKAHNNLGNALLQNGQVDEAMAQFQEAVEVDPNIAQAHYNLGNILLQKGQVDEAIIEFQKAIGVNSDYAEARNSLGIAFAQQGQIDEAIAQFQQALHLNPNDSSAQNNLAKAEAMIRQQAPQKQ